MASNRVKNLGVDISLHHDNKPTPEHAVRRIHLTADKKSFPIGRSSRVEAKGFVAAQDNGWFECPVMSRSHAEIVANIENKTVRIVDLGSTHGTYINDSMTKITPGIPHEIRDGDQITFGVPIWRNTEAFLSTKVRLGIDFISSDVAGAGYTFAVPELSDAETDISSELDNESEAEETDSIFMLAADAKHGQPVDFVDLTAKDVEEPAKITNITQGIIDLSSPPPTGNLFGVVGVDTLDEMSNISPSDAEALAGFLDEEVDDTDISYSESSSCNESVHSETRLVAMEDIEADYISDNDSISDNASDEHSASDDELLADMEAPSLAASEVGSESEVAAGREATPFPSARMTVPSILNPPTPPSLAPLPVTGQEFLTSPPTVASWPTDRDEVFEESISAVDFFKRTGGTRATADISDTASRKRKAEDISKADNVLQPTPVQDVLSANQITVRPLKKIRLRNIAERVGYAALGGATVGAAILTTLIYTAPAFT